MDILTRLKEIISFSGLSNRAFSIKCGIAQKTLDNQLKGLRSLSLDTTVSVLNAFPDVSAEWLLRGTGQILLSTTLNSENDRMNKLVDTIATLQEAINAKSETISLLKDRIKELENQLANK